MKLKPLLLVIIYALLLLTTFCITNYAKAQEITDFEPQTPLQSVRKWTQIYDVSTTDMIRVIDCESRGNPKALNPKDSDGLPAKGILQFKDRTFKNNASKINIEDADIWNYDHQIQVASYMWSVGEKRQWGCK